MIDLTMVFSVYGQPKMLLEQMSKILFYPEDVRNRLSVVIVDDCGKPPVAVEDVAFVAHLLKSLMLFRVTKDIPWNQGGARNLGMKHASGWCLLMDPDFVFEGDMIRKIMDRLMTMKRGQNLRFCLRHTDTNKIDNGSPNTHIVHNDDFMAAAGYDEDFAGRKGYSDVVFARSMRKLGIKETWDKDIWAHFYGTRDIPDANVTTLDRSVKANHGLFVGKMKIVDGKREGMMKWIEKRKKAMIRFPWVQVYPPTSADPQQPQQPASASAPPEPSA